ncbi:MAG: hypothetical protein ACR2HM_10990 [Acidimicrobiales bacterium]
MSSCGGGNSGAATTKADWDERYAGIVKVVSDDIDRSVQALNAGQRPVVLSECTQLQDDLLEARKAVPVPDSTVDAAVRAAFDATGTAVDTCVEGARIASDADKIEEAQAQMKTAREKYDVAQKAIASWQ